jgi:hypothetical protein
MTIATLAHIQKYLWINTKKLFYKTQHRVTYLHIIGRRLVTIIRQVEPIGYNINPRFLRVELNGIEDTMIRLKTITPLTFPYLIG